MRDLHSYIALIQTLTPATRTADANGAGVDRQGFESVEHLVFVGLSGDVLSGALKIDLKLEESDDNVTFTAVTAAEDVVGGTVAAGGIFATIDDPSEDETAFRIGYVGGKRYSRIVMDLTGVHTNGTPTTAAALLGHPHRSPTS